MAWQAVTFDDAAKERIQQAATFEKRLRLESLLGIPTECGKFKLRAPTIADLLEFEYAENRFVDDAFPQLDDYIHLLWKLRTDDETRSERDFAKHVALNLTQEERTEIAGFFNVQFNDMPTSGGGSVNEFDSSISMVSIIDLLCNEYGWSYEQVMATPLAVALQLTQRIFKRHDPKYSTRNGITQQAKANEMERLKHG